MTGCALPFASAASTASASTASRTSRSVSSPSSTSPGVRRLLQPRGDVDRVAGREPLLGAGHDLAGVHADAQLEPRAVRALELVVQPARPSRSSSAARTARSASSSCTVGTPKTAMTASPMNFSTVPPCRSRIVFAVSK